MPDASPDRILLVDGHVDARDGSIHRAGVEEKPLSTVQLALLKRLCRSAGEAVSREQLLVDVWELDPMTLTRTLDTAIKRLRKKLERDPRQPQHIVTAHRTGYLFRPVEREHTGWEAVQEQLRRDTGRVITLVGAAGAGKSWLVQHTFAQHVPVLSLAGCTGHDDLLLALSATAPGRNADDPVAYLRAAAVDRIVLDGIDGARASVLELAASVLAQRDLPRLVLTATTPLGLAGEVVVRLPPLGEDAARALFVAHSSATPDAVPDDVLQWAGGHPLALRITAGWFTRLGAEQLLQLVDTLDELPALTDGPAHQASVQQAVEATLERLAADHVAALAALCCFADGFRLSEALAVIEGSTAAKIRSLDALQAAGLVTSSDDTLRVAGIARHRLTPTDADRDRHARWVEAQATTHGADSLKTSAAIATLHQLLPDALRAHRWLATNSPTRALRLTLHLVPVLLTRTANAIGAALLEADPPPDIASEDYARLLGHRAELQRMRGHIKQMEATLQEAEKRGLHSPKLALARAMWAHMRGDRPTAIAAYQQLAEHDDTVVQLEARVCLLYATGGQMDRLEYSLREAADIARIAREQGYEHVRAVALTLLGRTEHGAGLLSQARADLEAARVYFSESGDARYLAQTAWLHGLLLMDLDDLAGAEDDFVEAEAISRAYGLAEVGLQATLGRGQVALVAGRSDEGLSILQSALATARDAQARGLEQLLYPWLAVALFVNGHPTEAQHQLGQAVDSPAKQLVHDALAGGELTPSDDPDLRLLRRALRREA